MVLPLVLFLSTSCFSPSESDGFSSSFPNSNKETSTAHTITHTISEKAVYLGTGAALSSLSFFSRLGWGISQILPWAKTTGEECLLLSDLCQLAAERIVEQAFKKSSPPIKHGNSAVLPSQLSWHLNQLLLSQIPSFTTQEKELLHFLENRWLAKATGFFPFQINWICPCFGVSVQVHPETTSSYARNPGTNFSRTYEQRLKMWKASLPQPDHYPLILTRPADLRAYFPDYVEVSQGEKIQNTVERLVEQLGNRTIKIVVDLSSYLEHCANNRATWLTTWSAYKKEFARACKESGLDLHQILCIQRVLYNEIGGVRLLPLTASSTESEEKYRFLLEWISLFGLSANRVELDRVSFSVSAPSPDFPIASPPSREPFLSNLRTFEKKWRSDLPQKALLVRSTIHLLKGILEELSDEGWEEVTSSPTKASIAHLSFLQIQEKLKELETHESHFFETASHIEEIHASLSALLEVFDIFTFEDFPEIYRDLLIDIPKSLKSYTSCALHASGMTSIAGIFKAVEKTAGKTPRILYGENAYFECIKAAERIAHAVAIVDAAEQDWAEVDLILSQFNPALKRIETNPFEYRVENVAEVVHRALSARSGKPLTLALDCTLDFINSPRVGKLLEEFRKEIRSGRLNIICYRSGLKFDLFGMDNYAGAPLFMIHNGDEKWRAFDLLLADPALQTDRLSLNWFCLAYLYTGKELEEYRKQIFANTRALLNRIPSGLLSDGHYRIVPVESDADAAFLDIKISGPLHEIRGATLVGGSIYLKCMEGRQPIFYRPSLGFYHPNFTMLFGEENTTIRLTLGLDPAQVDILAECFEKIDSLNRSNPLLHHTSEDDKTDY